MLSFYVWLNYSYVFFIYQDTFLPTILFTKQQCLQKLLSGQTEMTQFWPIKQIQLVCCILYIYNNIYISSNPLLLHSSNQASHTTPMLVDLGDCSCSKTFSKYNNCMQHVVYNTLFSCLCTTTSLLYVVPYYYKFDVIWVHVCRLCSNLYYNTRTKQWRTNLDWIMNWIEK